MMDDKSLPGHRLILTVNQSPQTNQQQTGEKRSGGKLAEPSPTEDLTSDGSLDAVSATKFTSSKSNATLKLSFPLFNELPVEIQRQIFEIAYQMNKQYLRRNDWVFICRTVREWIDPLVYGYISFPGGNQSRVRKRLQLYERTFRSKPKEFYSAHVRRIYTNHGLKYNSSDFELELLSVCDNITCLECWSDYQEALRIVLRTKSWPSLKTLCINIDLLPKDENTFRLPIFQHVTQLNFTSEQPHLPSWKSLQCLENLTHMCVNMLGGLLDSKDAMDHTCATAVEARKYFPPKLKYFLIIVPGEFFYWISNMAITTAEDRQRWSRMEDLRLGRFDERILIGDGGGDYDPNPDYEGVSNAREYLRIVPAMKYPTRVGYGDSVVDQNTWEEVTWAVRKRKKMQARVREV